MDTQEGKHLPVPHCIDGEDGWQLYGSIAGLKDPDDLVFSKPTFGSYELGEYLHKNAVNMSLLNLSEWSPTYV